MYRPNKKLLLCFCSCEKWLQLYLLGVLTVLQIIRLTKYLFSNSLHCAHIFQVTRLRWLAFFLASLRKHCLCLFWDNLSRYLWLMNNTWKNGLTGNICGVLKGQGRSHTLHLPYLRLSQAVQVGDVKHTTHSCSIHTACPSLLQTQVVQDLTEARILG